MAFVSDATFASSFLLKKLDSSSLAHRECDDWATVDHDGDWCWSFVHWIHVNGEALVHPVDHNLRCRDGGLIRCR